MGLTPKDQNPPVCEPAVANAVRDALDAERWQRLDQDLSVVHGRIDSLKASHDVHTDRLTALERRLVFISGATAMAGSLLGAYFSRWGGA